MLTAARAGRLTPARLVELMAVNPRRVFGLPDQPATYVEIDPDAQEENVNRGLHTQCGWTPVAGMAVWGGCSESYSGNPLRKD